MIHSIKILADWNWLVLSGTLVVFIILIRYTKFGDHVDEH